MQTFYKMLIKTYSQNYPLVFVDHAHTQLTHRNKASTHIDRLGGFLFKLNNIQNN